MSTKSLVAETTGRAKLKAAPRRYTYTELCAEMPQSNQPTELWEGELIMSPSPFFYHQEIVYRFHRTLDDWVSARSLGKVISAPMDMVLSERNVTQPSSGTRSRP